MPKSKNRIWTFEEVKEYFGPLDLGIFGILLLRSLYSQGILYRHDKIYTNENKLRGVAMACQEIVGIVKDVSDEISQHNIKHINFRLQMNNLPKRPYKIQSRNRFGNYEFGELSFNTGEWISDTNFYVYSDIEFNHRDLKSLGRLAFHFYQNKERLKT